MPFQLRKYLDGMTVPYLEKDKNCGNKLFIDYKEIINIISDESRNFLKTLYFNRENTENILYNSDKSIAIKDKFLQKISNLFYLDLLIMNDPNILNYEFSGKIILTIFEKLITINDRPTKIIMCKIIIDLIESYKGFGTYDNEINEKSLEAMNNQCKKEISKQIYNKEENFISFSDIIEQSIDKIYMNIFIKLIKEDNVNFNEIYNILKNLDFEEIIITENMFNEFKDFIENQGNISNKYYINEIEDLININKINFYYIVLKYFLKNQIFIYQFEFLLNTRKLITDLINNNLYTLIVLVEDLELSLGEKLEYIIKTITDIDYYFEKYSRMKESLKKEIKDKKLRYIYPLIPIIEESIKMRGKETKIDVILENCETICKLIKDKKYKKISKSIYNKLFNYFQEDKNKYLLLKIFGKEEYESFKKSAEKNEEEEREKEEEKEDYKMESINEADIDSESIQLEEKYISNVKDNFEEGLKADSSMIIESLTLTTNKLNKELEKTEMNTEYITDCVENIDVKMYYKSDKFKIIEKHKIIEKKYNYDAFPNFSKNLSKGHYITMLNSKALTLYDQSFEKKLEIDFYDNIRNVYEIDDKNNSDVINLIICFKNELSLLCINIQKYTYYFSKKHKGKNMSYSSFFKIDDNHSLINGEKGGFMINEKNLEDIQKIFDVNYLGGIKIDKKIYAFTSNKIMPQGKNKLVIYDFATKKMIKEIDHDYSFGFTSNGLCSINANKIKTINKNRQILVCSCKKEDKHGLLVLNMDLEKKEKEVSEHFFETKNFEPSCISQILIVENNNSITGNIINENNIDIKETEFLMVGGFDQDKRIGVIKLYKIQFDKKNGNVKVKYLVDIGEEDKENDFKGFDSNITCINQSKITGNLLINSLDGNINLFRPPNLECFMRK